MKIILKKIHAFLVKLPIVWFVLIMIALNFLISLSISFVLVDIFKIDKPHTYIYIIKFPYWLQLIILLPAAFLETIIYVWLVFKILRLIKYFRNNIIIIILISALLFSISHHDNLNHLIITFFSGVLFAYSYLVAEEKNFSPVLIVTIIHFTFNVIVFSIINAFYL